MSVTNPNICVQEKMGGKDWRKFVAKRQKMDRKRQEKMGDKDCKKIYFIKPIPSASKIKISVY